MQAYIINVWYSIIKLPLNKIIIKILPQTPDRLSAVWVDFCPFFGRGKLKYTARQ